MSLIDDLHQAAFNITPLIMRKELSHMAKAWEMVLGGLIARAMQLEDPKSVEGNAYFLELLEKYSPEKVTEFFAPKIVETEKIVEKKVEVEKIVERVVEVSVPSGDGTTRIIKVPVTDSLRAGKYRRLKDEVHKVKRFERDIDADDRDAIILWWNNEQRQVPEDDPVCVELAAEIDKVSGKAKLSPQQVSGYFSHLARMATWPEAKREKKIEKYVAHGILRVKPEFSKELIKAVMEHKVARDADKVARTEAHVALRAKKLDYKHAPTAAPVVTEPTPVAETTSTPEPVAAPTVEPSKDDETLRSSFETAKAPVTPAVVEPVAAPVSKPTTDDELDIDIKFARVPTH